MSEKKIVFDQLKNLETEQQNPASLNIDTCSIKDILKIINNEDKYVALSVETQIPFIAQAIDVVVNSVKEGGRLIYVGAGTSGRLGVLDAVECPPTFGTNSKMVQGLIAGGKNAMFHAQEGVEDREKRGAHDIDKKHVNKNDVVCGIAASLRTPYVIGAVKRAKQRGARTLFVTTNSREKLELPEFANLAKAIDIAMCPEVGPEVIMGSTRMKSGTAQKLVLNMITTATMIRLGKVYKNMMIDLQLNNAKLRERAKRIIMLIAGVSYSEATDYLRKADGHVKTALVMICASVSKVEAKRRLTNADGFVGRALKGKKHNRECK